MRGYLISAELNSCRLAKSTIYSLFPALDFGLQKKLQGMNHGHGLDCCLKLMDSLSCEIIAGPVKNSLTLSSSCFYKPTEQGIHTATNHSHGTINDRT